MSGFDGLPKLYRAVYMKYEYIHDTCQGGEHHQDCGYYYIKVKRVLDGENNVKWVVAEDLWSYCDYDEINIRDYVEEINDNLDYFEWSSKAPNWLDSYSDDEIMEMKIKSASKYTHNTPYKERKEEEEKRLHMILPF